MKETEYSLKLKHPLWKAKREKILKRDGFLCQKCSSGKNLQVHHKKYIGEPWEVPDKYLITLCKSCHFKEHKQEPKKKKRKIVHLYRQQLRDALNKCKVSTEPYLILFYNVIMQRKKNKQYSISNEFAPKLKGLDLLIEDNVFAVSKAKYILNPIYIEGKGANNIAKTNLAIIEYIQSQL